MCLESRKRRRYGGSWLMLWTKFLRQGLQALLLHVIANRPDGARENILGHKALVDRFHVVLHFVGPREFLVTDRAGENFPLMALVIEERVSLEAVLVFECFHHFHFFTLCAFVQAFLYRRIPK